MFERAPVRTETLSNYLQNNQSFSVCASISGETQCRLLYTTKNQCQCISTDISTIYIPE